MDPPVRRTPDSCGEAETTDDEGEESALPRRTAEDWPSNDDRHRSHGTLGPDSAVSSFSAFCFLIQGLKVQPTGFAQNFLDASTG
jgi:hypothetical protein